VAGKESSASIISLPKGGGAVSAASVDYRAGCLLAGAELRGHRGGPPRGGRAAGLDHSASGDAPNAHISRLSARRLDSAGLLPQRPLLAWRLGDESVISPPGRAGRKA